MIILGSKPVMDRVAAGGPQISATVATSSASTSKDKPMKSILRGALLSLIVLIGVSGFASAQTFHGDDCTEDCSGHEAGYNWAEQNDINDQSDCSTASQSFNEGCRAYVEEQSDDSSTGSDDEDQQDPDQDGE